MRTTMTDRRKVKEDEDMRPLYVDGSEKKEDRMNLRVYIMRRLSIKKLVIAVVVIILIFKLLEAIGGRDVMPQADMPPTPRPEARTWPHKYNPQGLTPDELSEILDRIKEREKLETELTVPEFSKVDGLDAVKGRYQSTGSLRFERGKFVLDGKPFRIISGAMHYFRVMPQYWDDRMKKMKACGLNTLETYVPWNLHEETPGNFNFNGMLDIRKYIQLAQKNGLYVLFRPGPYICSEWDFGGLPAWLLQDPDMEVRTNYPGYMKAVDRFFGKIIPMVKDLQHSEGGPIIGVQIENEFGSYSSHVEHLQAIKKTLIKYGIKELLFTSDGFRGDDNTGIHVAPFYDEALPTINFKDYYKRGSLLMNTVRTLSSEFPLVVMEFWSGWFDHWDKEHAFGNAQDFAIDVQGILMAGASINLYMFHGGTNFGFTSGANWFNNSGYKTDVTSYDYIAPLSEAGDITPKYEILRALIKEYVLEPDGIFDLPDVPPNLPKADYGEVLIDKYLTLDDIVSYPVKAIDAKAPMTMEGLTYNKGYGQNFGFLLYRTLIEKGSRISFSLPVRDRVQVMLNGIEVCVLDWHSKHWHCELPTRKMTDENMLDILVEQQGRVNYVLQGFNRFNEERKGIAGQVMLDSVPLANWKMYPLEFKEDYVKTMLESGHWKPFANAKHALGLYQGTLTIKATPADTFIKLQGWDKGVVFINGFNLGRYWNKGPQKTLYVPAPILKDGKNAIVIFELHKAGNAVSFQKVPEIGDNIPYSPDGSFY